MSLPVGVTIPLKTFIERNSTLMREEFLDENPGPFLMFRQKGSAPTLLNLRRLEELGHTKVTIGRVDSNDLCFPEGRVSSRHARLEMVKDRWALRDLGSTNGSFSDERIEADTAIYLKDSRRYSLAGVVELQFWESVTFYRELRDRTLEHRRTTKVRRASATGIIRKTVGGRGTKRMFRSRGTGLGRAVARFGDEISAMPERVFVKTYPCPFLILLNAHGGLMSSPEASKKTIVSKVLVQSKGLSALKFWLVAPRQEDHDSEEAAEEGEVIIGRGYTSDIVVPHLTVSRAHAILARSGATGNWRIEDLHSTNGLIVDGEKVPHNVQLEDEMVVRLGSEVLVQFMMPTTFRRFALALNKARGLNFG